MTLSLWGVTLSSLASSERYSFWWYWASTSLTLALSPPSLADGTSHCTLSTGLVGWLLMCKSCGSVLSLDGSTHLPRINSIFYVIPGVGCPSYVLYRVPMALSFHPPPIPLWRPWKTYSSTLSVTSRSQGLGGTTRKTLSAETCCVAIIILL